MYTNYSLYSNYVQLTPHGSMMGYISVDAAGVLELKISNPVNIFCNLYECHSHVMNYVHLKVVRTTNLIPSNGATLLRSLF